MSEEPALAARLAHLFLRMFRIFCTYSHSSRPTGSSSGRGRGAPYTTLHTAFSAKLRAEDWPSMPGLLASFPHAASGWGPLTSESRTEDSAALALGSPPSLA